MKFLYKLILLCFLSFSLPGCFDIESPAEREAINRMNECLDIVSNRVNLSDVLLKNLYTITDINDDLFKQKKITELVRLVRFEQNRIEKCIEDEQIGVLAANVNRYTYAYYDTDLKIMENTLTSLDNHGMSAFTLDIFNLLEDQFVLLAEHRDSADD